MRCPRKPIRYQPSINELVTHSIRIEYFDPKGALRPQKA